MHTITQGLRELLKDDRDYALGALGAIPLLSDIKPTGLVPRKIYNQIADGNDDHCSAYAIAGALSIKENADLFPAFQFAASKAISGDPDAWGQDLRSAMKATVTYGIPEESDITDEDKLIAPERRLFKNYEKLKFRALFHKQKTFFKTSGPYEPFDNVRAWMSKYQQPVILGVNFGWPISQYVLSGTPDGFGHALYAIDFTNDHLIVVNSAGTEAGQNGIHLLPRATANEYITKYGAFMHQDVTKEEATAAMDMYRSGSPWWVKLWKRLIT